MIEGNPMYLITRLRGLVGETIGVTFPSGGLHGRLVMVGADYIVIEQISWRIKPEVAEEMRKQNNFVISGNFGVPPSNDDRYEQIVTEIFVYLVNILTVYKQAE